MGVGGMYHAPPGAVPAHYVGPTYRGDALTYGPYVVGCHRGHAQKRPGSADGHDAPLFAVAMHGQGLIAGAAHGPYVVRRDRGYSGKLVVYRWDVRAGNPSPPGAVPVQHEGNALNTHRPYIVLGEGHHAVKGGTAFHRWSRHITPLRSIPVKYQVL